MSNSKPPVALVEYEQRSGTAVKRVRKKLEKGANLYELSGDMPQYKNCVIQEVDGYFNKIVVNGEDIYAGDAVGDLDEKDFRRIQIRETIYSHLQKEKALFGSGIKVLSLFFIDSVDKYRVYDDEGEQLLGEYAQIFEEEYNNARSEFLDLFNQEYNDYLKDTDPSAVHKGYMPGTFGAYLKRDNAEDVHDGYFSIDKKKKFIDPSVKRGKEDSDDISAYDLIMKDKERLLSMEEPTRFIFSHSALKEGWDNPNVFQICALKHTESASKNRRRQEVGRGMRLCVEGKNGVRQDYDTVGDAVHIINKLTIIASESYEDFAKGLQSEIAATLKDRPQKAEVEFFMGKVVTDAMGVEMRIDKEVAKKLNKVLYKNDIIDEDDKITEEGKIAIPARILLDTLKTLPEQPLTFSFDETTFAVEIKSATGKYKLAGENPEDFPKVPTMEDASELELPSEILGRAISNTLFATSNDELRPAMTGVYFQMETTGINFVATDASKLVKYSRKDVNIENPASFIVPKKALQLVKGSLPSQETRVSISYNNTNAFFTFNETQLICRLVDAKYPDYNDIRSFLGSTYSWDGDYKKAKEVSKN